MIAEWEIQRIYLAEMLKVRHAKLFDELVSILSSHDIDVRVLSDVRDIWARDFCPIQMGSERLIQFRYEPDYLRSHPKLRTNRKVAKQFSDVGKIEYSPIILDGGNVVASKRKAIVTNKIYRENPTWARADLRDELRRLLEVQKLIVIPKEPFDPIGHSDAMVRFIDEDSVVVNSYSKINPVFEKRLGVAIHRHDLAMTRFPYVPDDQIIEGIPSAIGCHINFLRTENVVIVPAFGIETDHEAQKTLQALIPLVPVVSLNCSSLAREGGCLNCIVAGVRCWPSSG